LAVDGPGRLAWFIAAAGLGACCAGLVLLAVEAGRTSHSPAVRACSPRIVLDAASRQRAGLATWPDGSIGTVDLGGQFAFVASDGVAGVATSTGTLGDPVASGVRVARIGGIRQPHDYAAGGPVLVDPQNGHWLVFYHAERWPQGIPTRFYAWIGMAVSDDQGRSWHDLGPIIRPHLPYDARATNPVEVGGDPYLERDGYLDVYFRNPIDSGQTSELSVARAPLDEVLQAGRRGLVAAWHDYYRGAWGQPALGGLASPLEPGNPPTRWFGVAPDPKTRDVLLVTAANDRDGVNLYAAFSRDGIHWSDRTRLTSARAELFYPTLVSRPGAGLLLYYTEAPLAGPRWLDANLEVAAVGVNGGCGS
jgi:hypothetical protein